MKKIISIFAFLLFLCVGVNAASNVEQPKTQGKEINTLKSKSKLEKKPTVWVTVCYQIGTSSYDVYNQMTGTTTTHVIRTYECYTSWMNMVTGL